eukprot:564157-Prorocentrum_minimum.AAC.2
MPNLRRKIEDRVTHKYNGGPKTPVQGRAIGLQIYWHLPPAPARSSRVDPSALWTNRTQAPWVYSHHGPIGRRRRGYILTTVQSDAGTVGIFSPRTNRTQASRLEAFGFGFPFERHARVTPRSGGERDARPMSATDKGTLMSVSATELRERVPSDCFGVQQVMSDPLPPTLRRRARG